MWKTLDVEDVKQSISDGKKKKRRESYSLHKEPFLCVCVKGSFVFIYRHGNYL